MGPSRRVRQGKKNPWQRELEFLARSRKATAVGYKS